jgi:hypothetical protein
MSKATICNEDACLPFHLAFVHFLPVFIDFLTNTTVLIGHRPHLKAETQKLSIMRRFVNLTNY